MVNAYGSWLRSAELFPYFWKRTKCSYPTNGKSKDFHRRRKAFSFLNPNDRQNKIAWFHLGHFLISKITLVNKLEITQV